MRRQLRRKGADVGTREKRGDRGVRGKREGLRRGSSHIRILVESFGNPGFLGNRGRGRTVNMGGRLGESQGGGGGRFSGKGKDGRVEVMNGAGVSTRGGNGLGKDLKDFGPIGRTKFL